MIDKICEEVESKEPDRKREALEDLGDYLEYVDWKPEEVSPILRRLIQMLGRETDEESREIILNDLLLAFNRGKRLNLDLNPIISLISGLSDPLIAYCLELLALSHNQAHKSLIERFRSHGSKLVREAAADALIEITGARPSP
jgi:hypothetical protein